MRMEMHCHTSYSRGRKITSDGIEPPETMVRRAKELGIDTLAITDHNTMMGMKDAQKAGKQYGVKIVPGEEVSSKHGHVTALGISETIRPGLSIYETVDIIHSQGGIAIAVHPFDINHDGLRERARACDAVETFNGINLDRISNIVARKFADRHNMPAVAGSDAHTAAMVGAGTITTKATNIDGILKSIKQGKVTANTKYVSVRVLRDYAVRRLQVSYDDTMKYIEENFSRPKKFVAKRMLGTVEKSPGTIDNFFNVLAYTAFVNSVLYSCWTNGIRR
jgi:predicted metal-dependent phosphoesterase TrpH